jgi:hypothetical protein
LADKELCTLEAFKRSKYRPKFVKQDGKVLMGTYEGSVKEIFAGPATKRGKDLQSGKIFFDYINKQGWMCLVCFFGDHKDRFPTLWILVQREASR